MRSRRHSDFRGRNAADWAELEEVAGRGLEKGVFRRNAELPTLMRLHRRVASSLATARAMAVEPGLVAYLEALVTRSHLALYGSTRPRRHSLASFVVHRIPRAIRDLRIELSLALGILLLGVAIGWALALLEPAWFFAFVDPDWIGIGSVADRTSTLRARLTHSAAWSPQSLDLGWTGLMAFALGAAAGIPTVVVLFSAGLGLGASVGLYAQRGLLAEFATWFLPHAVPGIAAVVLCGGAGLALARAVVFPKSGRASLGLAARDVSPLLIGATVLLGWSLAIEALVDPPGGLGAALAGLELAVLTVWIGRGGRGPAVPSPAPVPDRGRVEADDSELYLRFDGPEVEGLRVAIATLGERAIAVGIDLLLVGLVYAGCMLVFGLPSTDWALVLTIGFAFRHAYFVLFESRWQGVTPGKRLMALRVMARDGRGLDGRSLWVRNVLRDAEIVSVILSVRLVAGLRPHAPLPEGWLPIIIATAAIYMVMLLSRERRRLGDYVGDTIVIRTPTIPRIPEDALLTGDHESEFTGEQLRIYGPRELKVLADLLDGLVVDSEASAQVATEVAQTIADRIRVDRSTVVDPEGFLRRFYRAQRTHLERQRLRRGVNGSAR